MAWDRAAYAAAALLASASISVAALLRSVTSSYKDMLSDLRLTVKALQEEINGMEVSLEAERAECRATEKRLIGRIEELERILGAKG